MVEHQTVVCCGGLRREHKCSGLKVFIFTSPVSCLSSIFLSPGLLRLYQLELTEHDIIYSCPSENIAEWLGEAASVNGTGGSLRCCTQGLFLGVFFLIIEIVWIAMIPEALLCGSWWAAFSISTFISYYLPESCQVKVLEIIACEVVIHSCLSCGSEATEFIRTVNIYTF